jgi:hypothetical protein
MELETGTGRVVGWGEVAEHLILAEAGGSQP